MAAVGGPVAEAAAMVRDPEAAALEMVAEVASLVVAREGLVTKAGDLTGEEWMVVTAVKEGMMVGTDSRAAVLRADARAASMVVAVKGVASMVKGVDRAVVWVLAMREGGGVVRAGEQAGLEMAAAKVAGEVVRVEVAKAEGQVAARVEVEMGADLEEAKEAAVRVEVTAVEMEGVLRAVTKVATWEGEGELAGVMVVAATAAELEEVKVDAASMVAAAAVVRVAAVTGGEVVADMAEEAQEEKMAGREVAKEGVETAAVLLVEATEAEASMEVATEGVQREAVKEGAGLEADSVVVLEEAVVVVATVAVGRAAVAMEVVARVEGATVAVRVVWMEVTEVTVVVAAVPCLAAREAGRAAARTAVCMEEEGYKPMLEGALVGELAALTNQWSGQRSSAPPHSEPLYPCHIGSAAHRPPPSTSLRSMGHDRRSSSTILAPLAGVGLHPLSRIGCSASGGHATDGQRCFHGCSRAPRAAD